MSKNVLIQSNATQFSLLGVHKAQRPLLRAFWLGIVVLIALVFFVVEPANVGGLVGAGIIGFAALLPTYLWCSGRASGMPIFPILALSYLLPYAWPLLWDHPAVIIYSMRSRLIASLTVAGFLLLGTFVWFLFVRSHGSPPKTFRAFGHGDRTNSLFILFLAGSTLVIMAIRGGWTEPIGTFMPVLRAAALALSDITTITLAYHWGSGNLPKKRVRQFVLWLMLYLSATTASFLLVGAITASILGLVGYSLGKRRVPWLIIPFMLVVIMFLHHGKGVMRVKYLWSVGGDAVLLQPWEYPGVFAEWAYYGGKDLAGIPTPEYVNYEESAPLKERVSLIHILMMAQEMAPDDVPYLHGATYTAIPYLLLPRFIVPDKPSAQEGNNMLNVHYGVQKREDTNVTTIGWGMLSEAYANFGFVGCAGLAVILGAVYGYVTRWAFGMPLLSARSLFTMLFVSLAFQTEFSASVFLTALFQSTIILCGMVFTLMKVQSHNTLESSARLPRGG